LEAPVSWELKTAGRKVLPSAQFEAWAPEVQQAEELRLPQAAALLHMHYPETPEVSAPELMVYPFSVLKDPEARR